jgi:hypothetical protein
VQTEQKKIRELANRYWLEPTIKDVFVEGRADVSVVSRFLRLENLRDVCVYEIASVEIPPEPLLNAGLHDGKRGRVIFLAWELQKTLSASSSSVTCVADRDYDTVLDRNYQSPFLLFMDHCCMEMYCFDSDVLHSLLTALAPSLSPDSARILRKLAPLLQRLFALRATNIALGLGLKWLDSFEKSCTTVGDSIEFDEDDFITRYLGKNAQLKAKPQFVQKLSEISLKMDGDSRMFIRGHDLSLVLAWYLREHCSKTSPFFQPQVLEKFLLAMIDHAQLHNSQFFRTLLARVQS